MTILELRDNYNKMLRGEKNVLESTYKNNPANPSVMITDSGAGNSWMAWLIAGIIFIVPIGIIFIIIALVKKSQNKLSDLDKEFLSKAGTLINKQECLNAYASRINMKKLELGFEAVIDHINKKTYDTMFYSELEGKTGFLFKSAFIPVIKIVFKDGKTYLLYILLSEGSNFELKVEREDIAKLEIEHDIKTITDYSGGLLGAAIGAGLGYLTGESVLGGAAIGSTMGRGAETKQVNVNKTLLFLDCGVQFYFNGNAAHTYFNAYFNKKKSV